MNYTDTDRNVIVTNIDKKGLIIGIVALLVGIGLGIFSYFNIKSYNEKDKTYKDTEAVIVDYNYEIDTDNGDELRAIIVEYEVDGRKYRKESDSYSTITKSIGDKVMVKYNPNNPSEAIWKSDSSNIIVPIVSGLFVIVGIFVIVKYFKQNN